MKRLAIITILFFTAHLRAAEPAEIVARADAYRSSLDSFVVDVDLTSYRNGTAESTSRLRVYGKGADRSVVEFLAPAADKGRRLLMLKDAMWIYMPSASRPIRISPMQRLMGEASNGDIARSNFSIDYNAVRATAGEIDGRSVWVVELEAKDAATSYGRVRLTVDAATYEPRRAELFAASGKLLKTAHYRAFDMMAGRRVVKEIEIVDELRRGYRTVMRYSNLASRSNPDKMFSRDALGR
ncbi:MAG TPA: outer membrane lipoprotein-sorting protein [Thermoanaerobaculia bacterium]|nr:outer membrane lipoprotein-sorting protein [Thermoanaerobaculia bacterium]